MDEIVIRRAGPGDAPAVEALWDELQRVQGSLRVLAVSRDPDEHFRAEFASTVADDDGAWLLAEAGGVVVGMAFVHTDKPSRVSDELVVELSRVSVAAAWRGHGIGRMFVDQAERIARERGARFLSAKIFSRNRDAVAFWEALGFEPFFETRMKRVGDEP